MDGISAPFSPQSDDSPILEDTGDFNATEDRSAAATYGNLPVELPDDDTSAVPDTEWEDEEDAPMSAAALDPNASNDTEVWEDETTGDNLGTSWRDRKSVV